MESRKLLIFGPLPIRILAGITFIAHGLPKFEDVTGTQGFFGNIGLPPELHFLSVARGNRWNLSDRGRSDKKIRSASYNRMIGAIILVKLPDGFVGGYDLSCY